MHQNENNTYETSDLSLVATLLCFGATIESVDRHNGPRATFSIRGEKGVYQLVQAFFTHELKVDPLVYFSALREAKTRLHDRTIHI